VCNETEGVSEKLCGWGHLVNLHNGASLFQACDFPHARLPLDGRELVFNRCVFHVLEAYENGALSIDDEVPLESLKAGLKNLQAEAVRNVFEPTSAAQGFEKLGTQEFPISGHHFEKLSAESLVRHEPLFLEDCTVEGPIFFKNCEFSTLNLRLMAGERLTLTGCKIARINLHRYDPAPESIYLNNTELGFLWSDVRAYGDIRLEDSKIETFTDSGFTPFLGRIVSIRSELNFFGGDFSSAKVGVSDKVSFSRSIVRGCIFLTRNFDDWRRLKLTYNQNSSFFAVLLLIAFALPIALDLAYWQAVAGLQDAFEQANGLSENFELSACLSDRCRDVSLLWLVSGANQGFFYVSMTVALLLLNVVRVVLVSECAIIREWEDQSGLYPERGTVLPKKLRKTGSEGGGIIAWRLTFARLLPLDWIVRALLYVSLFSLLINLWEILQVRVLLPY
jgi:hypothetical protein